MAAAQLGARELEFAFAAEAAAHARAAAELNPYAEAEVLELGNARAVYSGAWSPVHGVSGLGLDGPVDERDLRELDRFFHRKERAPAFWLCPDTDVSLLEHLRQDYRCTRTIAVHGIHLNETIALPDPVGTNQPDLSVWCLAFTRSLDPDAKETSLLALTKVHQKEARLYLAQAEAGASYTFFHLGVALVTAPSLHSDSLGLLALQARDAKDWGAAFFATVHTRGASPLPFLYERSLYERL